MAAAATASSPPPPSRFAGLMQPYYLINVAAVLVWLPARYTLPGVWMIRSQGTGQFMMTREKEIWSLIGFAVMGKLRRASSTHEMMAKSFLFGKLAVGLCFLACNWVALALFACVCSTIFALVPAPTFAGKEHVAVLDGDSFTKACCRSGAGDRMAPVTLVAFTASWCDACTHAEPLFCSLAAQYSSERRKVATIDVGTHAHVANRYDIDLGVRTKQLPTFALFHGGKLHRRLPYFDRAKLPDAKVVVKTRFTRESLAKFFLLDLPVKDVVAKLKKIDQDQAAAADGGGGAAKTD